jgi:hypothetical protein
VITLPKRIFSIVLGIFSLNCCRISLNWFSWGYLNDGHRLEGVRFSTGKFFLPKEIKEKLYFIEAVQD